jgi:serine protease Do
MRHLSRKSLIAGAALAVLAASSAGAQSSRDDSSMLSNGLRAPNALADAHTTHQQPEGYLGITFVCDLRRQYGPEGLTIYHYGYPAVEFVQPGSPADRAGIVAGDTIVAYDSRDVLYRKIVLARLLRPGSELAVRIRRNGSVKNLNVSIAPRPATFVDMSAAGYGGTPPAQSGGSASLDPRQWNVIPATPGAPFLPAGPSASQRNGEPDDFMAPHDDPDDDADDDASSPATVAGAQVVRTNPDLQDALGLDGGLLVVAVAENTPAARAGLKSGDVIVSARGEAISTPQMLSSLLRRAKHDDQPISLRVVRRHQSRVVALK